METTKQKEDGMMMSKEDGMMMAHDEAGSGDPAMASTPDAPDGGVAADSPDHPDQDQDIELFKKLLAEYLGDDADVDQEAAMQMCQSAYGEAVASGMPKDEAMKCAGYGLKCAGLLSKKEKREAALPADQSNHADPAVSTPGEPGLMKGALKASKEGLPPPKAAQSHDASSDGMDKQESVKESKLLTLTAENIRLKESLRKVEISEYLEKLGKESKLSRDATNGFRALMEGKKSVAEIEAAWKKYKPLFKEAEMRPSSGYIFGVEKQMDVMAMSETSAEGVKSGFGDCLSTNKLI